MITMADARDKGWVGVPRPNRHYAMLKVAALWRNGAWEQAGWDDAVAETVKRLADIRRAHGDDAIAFYVGNPATHTVTAGMAPR